MFYCDVPAVPIEYAAWPENNSWTKASFNHSVKNSSTQKLTPINDLTDVYVNIKQGFF